MLSSSQAQKIPAWFEQATIYELYVDKFRKNFTGIKEKLDYFPTLGINTLHILPHYQSPLIDDGYDISDYRSIRPDLGTLDDFKYFTDAAHKRNLRVIVDLVLNHVSNKHAWFIEARGSRTNAKRSYFRWSDEPVSPLSSQNPFPDFKGNNWIPNPVTNDYYYATFYPEQPDLNWEEPQVMVEMLDIFDFWVNAGVDGFRLDAIAHLVEPEFSPRGTARTHEIVRHIRKYLQNKYGERIALLAETASPNHDDNAAYFGDNDECQLVYNFALADEILFYIAFGDRDRFNAAMASYRTPPPGSAWTHFVRNHDEVNMMSLSESDRNLLCAALDPQKKYPFYRGERTSVRLATAFQGDTNKILSAFECLYAAKGASVMYYGDEIGLTNLPTTDEFKDSRRYVRGAFDWDRADSMMRDPHSLLSQTARIIHAHAVR